MALTITQRQVDVAAGAVATPPGALLQTVTSITVGVAGDYSAGGIPLTPQQLSLNSQVFFGIVQLRTVGGAGTMVNGCLDCSSPQAPKLKLNTASAECAGAGVAGAIVDVIAYGC